jgi:hypothetical protein
MGVFTLLFAASMLIEVARCLLERPQLKAFHMAKIAKTNNGSSTSPSHEEIARRAYEIYERNGSQPGRETENWLAAEAELKAEAQNKPEAQKQENQRRPRATPINSPPPAQRKETPAWAGRR